MQSIRLVIGAVFVLGACSAESSEVLSGNWGGPGFELSATSSGAVIRLSCGVVVRVGHPLATEFTIDDPALGSLAGGAPRDTVGSANGGSGSPARLIGSISGNMLTLTVRYLGGDDASPVTFGGVRGQPPSAGPVCRD